MIAYPEPLAKLSCVYFAQPEGTEDGPVKIGTSYQPHRRVKQLKCPWPGCGRMVLKAGIWHASYEAEWEMHQRFAATRLSGEREWFWPSASLLTLMNENCWVDLAEGWPGSGDVYRFPPTPVSWEDRF